MDESIQCLSSPLIGLLKNAFNSIPTDNTLQAKVDADGEDLVVTAMSRTARSAVPGECARSVRVWAADVASTCCATNLRL
jgi:hypothetical protein